MDKKRTVFTKPKFSAVRLYKEEGAVSSSSSAEKKEDTEPLDLSMKAAEEDIKKEVENLVGKQSDGEDDVKKSKKSVKRPLPNGKKTLGRVKIEMKLISDKIRRQTTFAKRKAGLMKKTEEIAILTGAECFLLVGSETGKVFTYATPKLEFLTKVPEFKPLFQSCLGGPNVKEFQFAPPNSVFISSMKAKAMQKTKTEKDVPSTFADIRSASTQEPAVTSSENPSGVGPSPSSGLVTLADVIMDLEKVKEEVKYEDSD